VAQFDVYTNNHNNTSLFPYLLDVTHEINTASKLRVVVPLCEDSYAIKHLNPTFMIEGKQVYMSTMDIAGIPENMLEKVIANLESERVTIVDALDFLVNGF
jgi:hypothetical protein